MNSPAPSQSVKIKVGVLVAILAITLIWIIYQVAPMLKGPGPARPLDTAGWRTANDLSAKLVEHHEFSDVGISVESESPLKLKASGVVATNEVLKSLHDFLADAAPGMEIEYDVLLTKP